MVKIRITEQTDALECMPQVAFLVFIFQTILIACDCFKEGKKRRSAISNVNKYDSAQICYKPPIRKRRNPSVSAIMSLSAKMHNDFRLGCGISMVQLMRLRLFRIVADHEIHFDR